MAKKILFVDDSKSMRQVVGIALKKAGYDVETAGDGQEGVTKLDQRYHAIISDVNMPIMNGIEFIKEIKQNATNKFTPIIMLTTESAPELKKQGQEAGAKVWMVKPFKPAQLLMVLEKLLG